jgi:membrane fusion protein, multidrug efflux system
MTAANPAAGEAPRRRRFLVLGAAIVAALLVFAIARALVRGRETTTSAARATAAQDRAIPVQLVAATRRDVPIYLEGLGTVTAYKTVNVRAQVDGRLDRVAFKEGQSVKKGDLLAQIDPRPFTIQLHQAQAALARDQAQLEGATRNLERYNAVVADRLIPQQQVDDQRALVEQLRGTVQSDQTQIDNAHLQLDYAHITSPIEGVTGVRLVDPGNLVHASDAGGIVVITQMDPIAVLFTLPQDDLPRIARLRADDPSPMKVQAMSRDGNDLLATGELGLIDNQINQNTATIRLKAIFANPKRTLWPNQFVQSRLELTVQKGALVIPAVAVQRGPQGTFVYVVADDLKAAVRPVELDSIQGETAVVSKGLNPGERVVVEGQSQLRPGARVSLPAATRGGGASGGSEGDGSGGGDRSGAGGAKRAHGGGRPHP